jgi:acyl carrier protein
MAVMTRDQLVTVLHDLFSMPQDITDDADLREYLADSIDMGELAGALSQAAGRPVTIESLQTVTTLATLLQLVNGTDSTQVNPS